MSSNMNSNDLFCQNLIVLKFTTLERLGSMLNTKKFLTSSDQKLRDWRGLADYAGLDTQDRLRVEASKDHTREIVSIWCKKGSCDTTVRELVECLKAIDRYDVIDDLNQLFVRDCEAAKDLAVANLNQADYARTLSLKDVDALARGGQLSRFNAMVLFNEEDENDLDFGMHVVERMEAVGLRVFVPQRDLCAGTSEHAASADLIKDRCDKVVAIFSPSFVKSSGNLFLTNFAQHVGIQDNTNKIIPIIYKECSLPTQYNMYHKLAYKKPTSIFNFWDKLLVKTFDVKPLPAALKEYSFPLPGEELSNSSSTLSNTNGKLGHNKNTDTIKSNVSKDFDNFSQSSTLSSTMSESSRALLLPNPPTHDPSKDDSTKKVLKKKKKLTKLKEKLGIGKPSAN